MLVGKYFIGGGGSPVIRRLTEPQLDASQGRSRWVKAFICIDWKRWLGKRKKGAKNCQRRSYNLINCSNMAITGNSWQWMFVVRHTGWGVGQSWSRQWQRGSSGPSCPRQTGLKSCQAQSLINFVSVRKQKLRFNHKAIDGLCFFS